MQYVKNFSVLAMQLAGRLFNETPKAFRRRIAALWSTWQAKKR
jgi:hypothetical protein